MEGYEVVTMEEAAPRADISSPPPQQGHHHHRAHARDEGPRHRLQHRHFDNEIQIAHLKNLKWDNIKPQVDEITFPDNHRIILLVEGRL